MKTRFKAQGEIFGIALMFVIIILGILVYSQISKYSPNRSSETAQGQEYSLLAQTARDTVLEMSTGCFVERGRDSVSDLMNFCLSNSYGSFEPEITCFDGSLVSACSYSVEVINSTLRRLFSSYEDNGVSHRAIIGDIPYNFSISVPDYEAAILHGVELTNIGFEDEDLVSQNDFRKLGYNKAPSGIYVWESAYNEVYVDLNLYYR